MAFTKEQKKEYAKKKAHEKELKKLKKLKKQTFVADKVVALRIQELIESLMQRDKIFEDIDSHLKEKDMNMFKYEKKKIDYTKLWWVKRKKHIEQITEDFEVVDKKTFKKFNGVISIELKRDIDE